MLIGGKIKVKKGANWIENLLNSKFFESCGYHREIRRNEKNMFCIDCNLCFCKHCVSSSSHCFHEWLQICKYVYHDVVRLHEIQKYLNCSEIQTYKINGEKAVHLNPRPQSKDSKTSKLKGSVTCEACGRHLQDLPNRFCSIACKVSIDANICKEHYQKNFVSTQITKFDLSNENESCISLNESSEVIQTWCISTLKPRKNLHKRKGVPRRAPIC
ncbi:protein RGF1 INDUCIBLE TRANSCRIPTION FACTOR 1 isoform X1 [Capsicum annuum]|nr:protein RGF1 INDUCIBLE TRANSCRIPTION FACTOR 1 isoform X1 [Capsicum annuum]